MAFFSVYLVLLGERIGRDGRNFRYWRACRRRPEDVEERYLYNEEFKRFKSRTLLG